MRAVSIYKKTPATTKLQISEINPFALTSLKSLQLLASLSEQGPDPEPLKADPVAGSAIAPEPVFSAASLQPTSVVLLGVL